MKYNKPRKAKLPQMVEHQFRLWHNQRQYQFTFEASAELPKYRVKEYFDRNCVGTSKDTLFVNECIVIISGKEVLMKVGVIGE